MDKFWSKVNKTKECWLWIGAMHNQGYGLFYYQGKTAYVHRIAYELIKGPIPKGLQIDHLCRVRACVNPDHLEAVTQKENILRGVGISAVNARKTYCKRGHPLSGSNLYMYLKIQRHCRICRNKAKKKYRKIGQASNIRSSI